MVYVIICNNMYLIILIVNIELASSKNLSESFGITKAGGINGK